MWLHHSTPSMPDEAWNWPKHANGVSCALEWHACNLSVTALNEFKCVLSFITFYSATVPEHALLGSKVLEVECEDADQFEEVVVSIVSWTPSTKPLPFTLLIIT